MKTLKNGPQKLLIIGPNLFFHSPAYSQELVFHIINMSQDPSVSLSVATTIIKMFRAFKKFLGWKILLKEKLQIKFNCSSFTLNMTD